MKTSVTCIALVLISSFAAADDNFRSSIDVKGAIALGSALCSHAEDVGNSLGNLHIAVDCEKSQNNAILLLLDKNEKQQVVDQVQFILDFCIQGQFKIDDTTERYLADANKGWQAACLEWGIDAVGNTKALGAMKNCKPNPRKLRPLNQADFTPRFDCLKEIITSAQSSSQVSSPAAQAGGLPE